MIQSAFRCLFASLLLLSILLSPVPSFQGQRGLRWSRLRQPCLLSAVLLLVEGEECSEESSSEIVSLSISYQRFSFLLTFKSRLSALRETVSVSPLTGSNISPSLRRPQVECHKRSMFISLMAHLCHSLPCPLPVYY